MSSRSDSILNTGISGATINKSERMRKQREARTQSKEVKKSVLTPVAELVLGELEKEKKRTSEELLAMITAVTPDENVKGIIVSLNLYTESVNRLRSRLTNIMRVRDE